MPEYAKNKRDANEPELAQYWTAEGWQYLPMPPGAGFDGLLFKRGIIYIVEIKAETAWRLTKNEIATLLKFRKAGCQYHIVANLEQAENLIRFGKTTPPEKEQQHDTSK